MFDMRNSRARNIPNPLTPGRRLLSVLPPAMALLATAFLAAGGQDHEPT
jgi:hypothetical protein